MCTCACVREICNGSLSFQSYFPLQRSYCFLGSFRTDVPVKKRQADELGLLFLRLLPSPTHIFLLLHPTQVLATVYSRLGNNKWVGSTRSSSLRPLIYSPNPSLKLHASYIDTASNHKELFSSRRHIFTISQEIACQTWRGVVLATSSTCICARFFDRQKWRHVQHICFCSYANIREISFKGFHYFDIEPTTHLCPNVDVIIMSHRSTESWLSIMLIWTYTCQHSWPQCTMKTL